MSRKILQLARDTITVHLRYFDAALMEYELMESPGLNAYVADGKVLRYDPVKLLKDYSEEPGIAVRLYLHVLFHGIFLHAYRYDKVNEHYWNMACDIAVENTILELNLPYAAMSHDEEQKIRISKLKKWVPAITAEKLYREFMVGGISNDSEKEYMRLFTVDTHRPRVSYKEEPETIITEEDWKRISERVKAELKSFSEKAEGEETITQNLEESTKVRYDYEGILRKFAVQGEELLVNPDEFDYVYYTYGLKKYGNLPLIEPLEYAEVKRVKEFVVALDTSASVRGELLKKFLSQTFDVLTSSDSFFKQIKIHILQCDSKVREDVAITSREELDGYLENITLKGFGATDFRPVFEYVDDLIEKKEFENLKGLIYFTDGYGIYPSTKPKYDVIFAFSNEDKNRPKVPGWAIGLTVEDE